MSKPQTDLKNTIKQLDEIKIRLEKVKSGDVNEPIDTDTKKHYMKAFRVLQDQLEETVFENKKLQARIKYLEMKLGKCKCQDIK